jgi:DNA-binding MarR family transcriptional regulator
MSGHETNGRNKGPASTQMLPFETSVGYQIRVTHRLMQRYLQQKIEPYGVTPGMWYFLRALWEKDGLTQRELSVIVGTMQPTTLTAIKSMVVSGLVTRMRNEEDRRKINIYLTPRGRELKDELLPLAKEVVENSVHGFSGPERRTFLRFLSAIQSNLLERIGEDISEPE